MIKTGRVVAAMAALAAVIGLTSAVTIFFVHRHQAAAVGEVAQAESEAQPQAPATPAFNAADFKFPELIERLNKGDSTAIVNTDEAVFALYYLKEFNEVFGDPDMKVFLDEKCFTEVYDADMTAQLQAVFWTKVLPRGLWELGTVLSDGRPLAEALSGRYPILSGMLKQVASDVPEGKLDRLFILGNFPKILQTRARQDAITLFKKYKCESPVTRRIYANAVVFVKAYRARYGS